MDTTKQETGAGAEDATDPAAVEYRSAMEGLRIAALAFRAAAQRLVQADQAFDPDNVSAPAIADRIDWSVVGTILCAVSDFAPGYRELFEVAGLPARLRAPYRVVRALVARARQLLGK